MAKEDVPPLQQQGSPHLDLENSEPSHIKEEHEELSISLEGEQLQGLIQQVLVKQHLPTASEESFKVSESIIAKYKEELCHLKKQNKRQKQLDAVFEPKVLLHRPGCPVDIRQLLANNKDVPSKQLDQENPEPYHIKEEPEELWIKQEEEQLQGLEKTGITEFPSTLFHVKSEDDEEKPQLSQLHQRQTENYRDETEEHFGRSEQDRSSCPEKYLETGTGDETEDSEDTEGSDEDDTQSSEVDLPHIAQKTFSCSVCQKRFSHKNNVKRHMDTHTGKKPFSCSVCGAKFARKSHLNDHHMARHTKARPFECLLCKKLFGCENNFKKHMKRHIMEKPLTSCVGNVGAETKHNSQTKRQNCSECGQSFGSASILKRHMKVHTGEKPHVCSECGKRFARNAHLINHMTQHTGEKPYSCSVCKRGFARKDCVKSHMKLHTRKEQRKVSQKNRRNY